MSKNCNAGLATLRRTVTETVRRNFLGLQILGLAIFVGLGPSQVAATAVDDPSGLCESAAAAASEREGVPLTVMRAIALSETGQTKSGHFRPWPWTVNMEGKGYWFSDRDTALRFAQREYDRGARSFDIGCFQINFRWHGEHFRSIDQMFDPMANAVYAARFLRDLYLEQGSWEAAAGAYHSRTPELAAAYASRFARLRESVGRETGQDIPEFPDIMSAVDGNGNRTALSQPGNALLRVNDYPLLRAGGGQTLGSLVPIGNGSGLALFGGGASAVAAE